MTITWFDQKNFKRQLWKNGLGETLELFCLPDPQSPQDFLFRLSMAKIQTSGPFSFFPGVDRHLTLIEGTDLTLKRESGELVKLPPFIFFSFPGEEKIYSEVSAPCLDFNVMIKRSWKKAQGKTIYLPKKGTLRLHDNSFLYQVSGELKYDTNVKQAGTLWEIKQDIEIESLSDSTSILITII